MEKVVAFEPDPRRVLVLAQSMKSLIFVCTTLLATFHPLVRGQTLTSQAPLKTAAEAEGDGRKGGEAGSDIPVAVVLDEPMPGVPVTIHADSQEKHGDVLTLSGNAEIHYRNYIVRADRITYNTTTREAQADGHLEIDGGPGDEHISASNGVLNLEEGTGRFSNVIGSIGVRNKGKKRIFTTANPFLFTGRVVIKSGPERYSIFEGTMTSCSLPKPDWRFMARRLSVEDGTARAFNSTFDLLGVPVFYLPYVTHATETKDRQTGFLIPTFGTSSTKGLYMGEQVYWAINRSADLTVGAEYYSKRGWAQNAEFRYRGREDDFFRVRYTGLLDRGIGNPLVNQGGEDALVSGHRALDEYTRIVVDAEYLSSYIYRQAFTESFALAVTSEVKSTAFVTREKGGYAGSLRFDRYQNFEDTTPGNEVRILHLPSLDFDGVDRALGRTGLYWGGSAGITGMSRSEPGFQTSREVGRMDIHPHVSFPLVAGGWTLRPYAAVRGTFYSKSQKNKLSETGVPVEVASSLSRKDFEGGFELRPPPLERVFDSPMTEKWFGSDLKHTIEPKVEYRYVTGVGKFNNVLRFDPVDLVSDTNEIEYSLTQRLFLRSVRTHPCKEDEMPEGPESSVCGGGTQELLSWQVAQKYFFDPGFGGAVTNGRRNVLDTTIHFAGVAFLTGPRTITPVLSRLRLRTTGHTDLEWDLDYDTKAGRVASSNVFVDYKRGDFFGSFGDARLDAPGEALVSGKVTQISDFSQMRLLVGYGDPNKRGLTAAASGGLDLRLGSIQYGTIQTSYNWNCCGLAIEYRRFALGSARNENQYRFSFTLAGIGTAGNLRRAERIF